MLKAVFLFSGRVAAFCCLVELAVLVLRHGTRTKLSTHLFSLLAKLRVMGVRWSLLQLSLVKAKWHPGEVAGSFQCHIESQKPIALRHTHAHRLSHFISDISEGTSRVGRCLADKRTSVTVEVGGEKKTPRWRSWLKKTWLSRQTGS